MVQPVPPMAAPAEAADAKPLRGAGWLSRCLFPFAGRGRRDDAVAPSAKIAFESSGFKDVQGAVSSSTPADVQTEQLKVQVADLPTPVNASERATPVNAPELATPVNASEAGPRQAATAVETSPVPAAPVAPATPISPAASAALATATVEAAPNPAAAGREPHTAEPLSAGSAEVCAPQPDAVRCRAPAPMAPPPGPKPATGTSSSDFVQCWWGDREPLPMELLESETGHAPPSETENVLPPLPNIQPHWIAAPRDNTPQSPHCSPTDSENETLEPLPPMQKRPCTYRRKASRHSEISRNSVRDPAPHRGSGSMGGGGASPRQKTLSTEREPPRKGSRLGSANAGSLSSRPTTAGAESLSTYSTSWREEWTPGATVVEKMPGRLMMPPPPPLAQPPPLPPLPARPGAEGGPTQRHSVGTGADLKMFQLNGEASDAALKRVAMSANVKAATPPPLSKRRASSMDRHEHESQADTSGVSVAEDGASSAASPGKKSNPALDDSAGSMDEEELARTANFSELARAFAVLEVT